MTVRIMHGDSRELLKSLTDNSIDSVVCDPPYALVSIGKRFGKDGAAPAKAGKTGAYARASAGFMGKKWDTGETAFDPAFWGEVLRVLKPGGHVVAFSGTRTYHRMACAIEDAGFEIRDQIGWLYGSGFPKSHDVAKGIDKMLGAQGEKVAMGAEVRRIRPGADQHKDASWEKLDDRTYQPHAYRAPSDRAAEWAGWGTALKPAWEPICVARKALDGTVAGNVLKHGTGALNVDGCRVAHTSDDDLATSLAKNPGRTDTVTSAVYGAGRPQQSVNADGRWPANVLHDGSAEVVSQFPQANGGHWSGQTPSLTGRQAGPTDGQRVAEDGSAARFFYAAKAGPYDRFASKHPTVKPVDLMRWLARLVTPPGGLILDPFAGTGTTGAAAMAEGFGCILMEREAEYVADIERRIAWMQGDGPLTAQAMAPKQEDDAGPLFG